MYWHCLPFMQCPLVANTNAFNFLLTQWFYLIQIALTDIAIRLPIIF